MHRPLQRLFPLITQIFFKFPDCHYHPLSHPCPFPRVTCVHVNTPFYFSPFQLCLFCLCDLRIHTKHPQRCVRCKKLRCRQRYALADGQVDETILFVQRREWEGMWQRVRGLLAENFVDVRRKSGINARGGDICVGSRHGVIRSSCELRPGVIRGSHSGHTSGSSETIKDTARGHVDTEGVCRTAECIIQSHRRDLDILQVTFQCRILMRMKPA